MSKIETSKNLGVLGGTFDPPHFGHLEIAKFAIKRLKLSSLIWAVTKQNPLKKKPFLSLKNRVNLSIKITRKFKKIKVKSYDGLIKSSKTIKQIQYIKRDNKRLKIFFLMGSDSILTFHRWDKWKRIAELCSIIVFPRPGYVGKVQKCKAFKTLGAGKIQLIRSKRVNISSSKIRKNYLKYSN